MRAVQALILMTAILVGGNMTAAAGDNGSQPEMGTPEQRNACGPDVGRFCKKIKPEDGPMAYLTCLQSHRAKLSGRCQKMLAGVGQ